MDVKDLKIGTNAPDFRDLPGVDGKKYSLSSFAGKKVTVVVFSCNHCPYVQAYEERMIAFQHEYAAKGVQLIAINSNEIEHYPENNFDAMVERAKMKGYTFPYLRDDDQSVATAYGATHTPEFFVFDDKRKLRYHGKFDDNYQNPQKVRSTYVRNAVDALLEGKDVAEPETYSIGCTIKWKT
jgi:peroxiredoxin